MFKWFKKEPVSKLTKLLEAEQKERKALEAQAVEDKRKISEMMLVAEFDEKTKVYAGSIKKKESALIHLRAAERYIDGFNQAKGARKSELQAIIDARLEKAANLGYPIQGDITQAIMDLE